MIKKYINDDLLNSKYDNIDRIICHIVNNKGGMGKGFALSLSQKYPKVKDKYKEWYAKSLLYGDAKFKLGCIQDVWIDEKLNIINMLCQNGYKSNDNKVPLDYMALEMCLIQVNDMYKDREIWMPKIGSGLAGGDFNEIEKIINRILKERDVFIFEL